MSIGYKGDDVTHPQCVTQQIHTRVDSLVVWSEQVGRTASQVKPQKTIRRQSTPAVNYTELDTQLLHR